PDPDAYEVHGDGPGASQLQGRSGRMSGEEHLFLPGLLAWWSVSALAIYSWAGEKMPWLTIHMVLPLALLSGWALARLLAWALRDGVRWPTWVLAGMALALIVPTFLLLNVITRDPQKATQAWFWPLLIILALGLLVSSATVLGGPRQGLCCALGAALLLLPFTIRSSLRLSFVNGDVPVEPLVFVQTGPDVPRVMRDLERVSLLQGSHADLPIRYDNETVWQWYLRNYTRTEGSGGQVISSLSEDVQAVFLLEENLQANAAQLEGFVRQRYPLRWWFPECDVYRFPARDKDCGPNPTGTSIISRFLRRPWDGAAIADMWQFWMYRRLPAPLGSTDWVLLVRPEIAPQFGLSGSAGQ
ncbi:MAG: TIGR03663 family protein, partial [Chloroflexota bacterium]|nr:TIGR03663 family protein [Chloroflexota bacterium]